MFGVIKQYIEKYKLKKRLSALQSYNNSYDTPDTRARCAEIAVIFNRLRDLEKS